MIGEAAFIKMTAYLLKRCHWAKLYPHCPVDTDSSTDAEELLCNIVLDVLLKEGLILDSFISIWF